MPRFAYSAKNTSGKIVKGEINAPSSSRAKSTLANKGLKPLRVTALKGEDGDNTKKGFFSKIVYKDKQGQIQIQFGEDLPSTKELALFTKQFSLMIENGIPMLKALKLLEEQQKKMAFQQILESIHNSIEQGANLSDSLEAYPEVFDSLYVSMTRAGEASGRLDIILKQLVTYIEKTAKLKSQVKSAMAYPSIIVLVSIIVISVLLVFVVPSFAQQFADSGNELPGVTQMVIDSSNLIINNWPVFIGVFILSFLAFRYWLKTPAGRRSFDTFILRAPLMGDVISKIAIGRFCSTMSTMLNSGVSILEALEICAASSGNTKIEEFVLKVKDEISKGENFAEPLQSSNLFPSMVSSMVAVGESTGTLDETLGKVTEIYEDEVDNAIAAMMSMIEPIMIVTIGGIVGFILIAMYLPIFDMAGNVG